MQSTQPSLLFTGRNTVQDTAFPATSTYLLSTKSYTRPVGIKYGLQHQHHSATSEERKLSGQPMTCWKRTWPAEPGGHDLLDQENVTCWTRRTWPAGPGGRDLLGGGPSVCVLTNLPGDSGATLKMENECSRHGTWTSEQHCWTWFQGLCSCVVRIIKCAWQTAA